MTPNLEKCTVLQSNLNYLAKRQQLGGKFNVFDSNGNRLIGRVGSMNSEYCCSFDGTIFVWFQTEKDGAEMIERISFGCRIKSAKQPTKYYSECYGFYFVSGAPKFRILLLLLFLNFF